MLLDLGDLTTSGRVTGEEILTNWQADRFIAWIQAHSNYCRWAGNDMGNI